MVGWFGLKFDGPVNTLKVMTIRSVYLHFTRGGLALLAINQHVCIFFHQKLATALLDSAEGRG